jgi:predicted metal-dependent peptidase
MDLTTTTFGTDGEFLRYNPTFLMQAFARSEQELPRAYLHALLHCLLGHLVPPEGMDDHIRWNLCADIAAESVIDLIENCAPVSRLVKDKRAAIYAKLEGEIKVLTAQRLYRHFEETGLDGVTEAVYAEEFCVDDHSFWEELQDKEKPEKNDKKERQEREEALDNLQKKWEEKAGRVLREIEASGAKAGKGLGNLVKILSVRVRKKVLYRDFLKKFAVLREEPKVDPDSFDYGFYNYGLTLYGNMPLIEENEYCESKKVSELVIAIDTSASCQGRLVEKFLRQTAAILGNEDVFLNRVNLRILECDDKVRADVKIEKPSELADYMEHFEVRGGGGTDFRPAFEYVESLMDAGELKELKGLIYLTDGFGEYPKKPTPYETVFVYQTEEMYFSGGAPRWAVRLLLDSEGNKLRYEH